MPEELETILRERYSPAQLRREFRKRMPELITHAPDMPRLIREWLVMQTSGAQQLQMRSVDLQALVAYLDSERHERRHECAAKQRRNAILGIIEQRRPGRSARGGAWWCGCRRAAGSRLRG